MNIKKQLAQLFLMSLSVLSFSGCSVGEDIDNFLQAIEDSGTTKGIATNEITLSVYDSSGVGLEYIPNTLYIGLRYGGKLVLGDGDRFEIYTEAGELLNYRHVSWEACGMIGCGIQDYYAFEYDYAAHKVINIQFIRRNNVSAYNTVIQLPTIPEVQQYSPQTVYSVSNDTLSLDWTPDENMLPTRMQISICNDTHWEVFMGSSAIFAPGTFVTTCDGEHDLSIYLSRSMELTKDPAFAMTHIGHSLGSTLILTAKQ